MSYIDKDQPPEVQRAIDNILSFEICNITRYENATVCPSPFPHRCSFWFTVKQKPSYTYHSLRLFGKEHLVARCENTGLMHSYTHIPGSTDGFAGRKIELWIHGGVIFPKLGRHKRTYKGSLWDTTEAKSAANAHFKTTTVSVAYRQPNDGLIAFGCEMDARVFNAILRMSGLKVFASVRGGIKPMELSA